LGTGKGFKKREKEKKRKSPEDLWKDSWTAILSVKTRLKKKGCKRKEVKGKRKQDLEKSGTWHPDFLGGKRTTERDVNFKKRILEGGIVSGGFDSKKGGAPPLKKVSDSRP